MIKVKKVTKKYKTSTGKVVGIKNATFDVEKGEVVCILGKSGSGKSTLLRSLSHLEDLDSGSVEFDQDVNYGYVAQSYALWPHLTVLENMILAPSLKKGYDKKETIKEAKKLLKRFDLGEHMNAYPSNLSGGQKQRVALLRAVMVKPDILFLDEITSALDPELTKGVLDLIRALSKDGYTMMIVTHHVSFALSVADRVLFLDNGKIVADQPSAQFFMNQQSEEIRSFISDIAKRDENVQIFKGVEQYQAYHLGLLKRLPKGAEMLVAGAVGDRWSELMGEFYGVYDKLRLKKEIIWKMAMYAKESEDIRLEKEHPEFNKFRKLPRSIQNPANYVVFEDTVITQIFDDEPVIIEIKNQAIADSYKLFFEELWESSR